MENRRPCHVELSDILSEAVARGATDVYVKPHEPIWMRLNAKLVQLTAPITASDAEYLCYSVMDTRAKKQYETQHNVDFSFSVAGVGRFRANVFRQRGSTAGVFRLLKEVLYKLEELNLPEQAKQLANLEQGLILITGPTGSGKSTTLAAYVDYINRNHRKHIITLEDPIEYVFQSKHCSISQREVGRDIQSFADGLRAIVRQDPDVIVVGEMRDPESTEAVLSLAETGHLVFSTLHTNNVIETLARILSIFPRARQNYIASMLSLCLKGVIAQRLIPRADGRGLVLATEFLYNTPAVARMIRENKPEQLLAAMQTNQLKTGMRTLTKSLEELYKQKLISRAVYEKYMNLYSR